MRYTDTMAGVHISIEGLDQVQADLTRLLRLLGSLTPVMRDIGEYLLRSHHDRWASARAPDGDPWAPLSPVTVARKKRNADKILIESGIHRDSLRYLAHADRLELGTDRIYGAVHQFGERRGAAGRTKRGAPIPWGDIPARPYLGLSGDDEREIGDIIVDHLTDVLT